MLDADLVPKQAQGIAIGQYAVGPAGQGAGLSSAARATWGATQQAQHQQKAEKFFFMYNILSPIFPRRGKADFIVGGEMGEVNLRFLKVPGSPPPGRPRAGGPRRGRRSRCSSSGVLLAGQAPQRKLHRQVIGPKAQVGELEGVPKLLGQGASTPFIWARRASITLVPSGGEQLLCGDVRPGRRVEGVGPLDLLRSLGSGVRDRVVRK